MSKGKAIAAMSGGVDSSVAAHLTKEAGYETIGVTLRLYGNECIALPGGASAKTKRTCCSLEDADHARAVCAELGIPFYIFDFSEDFDREVMKPFASAYLSGLTPNPCIDCNTYIKFKRLYERMRSMHFDTVVTGHYARISYNERSGRYRLRCALDDSKDQSYVLYTLTQDQLAHTLFPLGELAKKEVRAIAASLGFTNADKPDSQDICFVPDGDYASFIERYTGEAPARGDFIDAQGRKMGTHLGITHYTIGQRKGLGRAFGEPMYVIAIDPKENTVTLGREQELLGFELSAHTVNFIGVPDMPQPTRVLAKIRYNATPVPATAVRVDDLLKVVFDEPVRAITPGQAAVLYDIETGESVLAGGIIA